MIKHNKQFYPESFFWNDTEIEIEKQSELENKFFCGSDNNEYKNSKGVMCFDLSRCSGKYTD